MQKEYLNKAIKVLEKPLPENSTFTMSRIHTTEGKKVCMCIGAILTFSPFFKKLGLKLSKPVKRFGIKKNVKFRGLEYKEFIDTSALRELFGLNYDQWLWIFSAASKGNQKDAIKRIKQVIKGTNPHITKEATPVGQQT